MQDKAKTKEQLLTELNQLRHRVAELERAEEESTRAEEALRKGDERLRSVLDATPFPTAVVDLQDDNIHFWSRSALSVFGHTAPTASEWYRIAYPDPDYRREVIDRWKSHLEKARDSRKSVNTGEYRVTCKDGSARICELYATVLPDILIVTFNDITERKQAEEKLRQSSQFPEENPNPVMRWTPQGQLLYANVPARNWLLKFGAQANAFVPEPIRSILAEAEGKGHPIEVELSDAEGRTFIIYGVQPSGENYVNLYFLEITDSKLAEEALRDSEARYRELVENANSAIIRWKTDGTITLFNEYAQEFFGFKAREMIGKNVGILVPERESDGADLKHLVQDIVNHPDRYVKNVNENVCRDGQRVWMTWTNRAIYDEHGQVSEILAIGTDITERKRMEEELRKSRDELELRVCERTAELERTNEALRSEINEREKVEAILRESENRFRQVLENSLDVPYRRNLKTDSYDYMSPRFMSLTGYSSEEMAAMPITDVISLIHPDDREYIESELHEAAEKGKEKHKLEYRFKHKDGSYRWFSDLIAVLKDEDGKPIYRVGSVRDTTLRKNAEIALKDSETRLRDLSSKLLIAQEEERKRIARDLHDSFGSTLSGVKYCLESIFGQLKETSAAAKSMETVISTLQIAIDEARRLMSNLRPPMLDDLGLGPTIHWFCRQLESTYPSVHVKRRLEFREEEIPEVLKIAIYRVMQEAVNNAAKYSRAEMVSISLCKREDRIELIIRDNGKGFDLDAVLTKKHAERGLGLTSMRERTDLSGGIFALESAPGAGTLVRAHWPLTS